MQWRTILRELGAAIKDTKDLTSLRARFDEIDKDGSGALDPQELGTLLEGLGAPVSVGTLSNMVRLADKDASGTISFDEFSEIVAAI